MVVFPGFVGLVFGGNALTFSLFVSCCGIDSVWVSDLLFALRLVVGLGCTCCFWVSSLLGLLRAGGIGLVGGWLVGFGCLVFCSLLLCSWVFVAYDVGWVVIDILVGKVWLVLLGLLVLDLWGWVRGVACCLAVAFGSVFLCMRAGGLVGWWFGGLAIWFDLVLCYCLVLLPGLMMFRFGF